MSLESKIDTLTVAINALNQNLGLLLNNASAGPAIVPQPPAPVQQAPAFAAPEIPAFAQPAPAVTMPAPPSFAAPVASAAPAVPFSDNKGLIDFVMTKYKELGPEKGAGIQNILGAFGVANINDIKPEQYAAFYQAVLAL